MPNSTSTPTSANQSRLLIIEDLLRAKFPMYNFSLGLSVMYDEAKINHKEMHTARETERAQLLALPEQEFQARWARHVAQESAKYVSSVRLKSEQIQLVSAGRYFCYAGFGLQGA